MKLDFAPSKKRPLNDSLWPLSSFASLGIRFPKGVGKHASAMCATLGLFQHASSERAAMSFPSVTTSKTANFSGEK